MAQETPNDYFMPFTWSQKFEHEVRTRLTGAPIDRVELLQYGDAPQIEPGELLGRIVFALPEGADPADLAVRKKVGGSRWLT